jgi:hypothetical protein
MTEQQIELSPVQALLIIGLFGVYGTFVPNPWDIGETILSAVNYASTCTTDFCKENSDRLLKYYNLGTILMMPSGFGLALYVYKNNR